MRGDSYPLALYWFIVVLVLHATSDWSVGQESQSLRALGEAEGGKSIDIESDQIQKWFAFYDAEAASYELAIAGESATKLQLHPLPLLSYTNPIRNAQQHGAFYVWTLNGRPQAIGSIWTSVRADDPGHRHVSHEFQSLSQSALITSHAVQVGHRGVVPAWKPPGGGIEFKPVPGAPVPATKATARLIQMRQLSRNFQASIVETNDEENRTLRLLTQPAFRYECESADVSDGALFTFVMGTDPEVILLLEAVKSESTSSWNYAIARFTNQPLRVSYRDQEIWGCPIAEPYVGNNPYFIYWRVSRRNAVM